MSEPPRTAEDWEVWADACIQTNSRHLLPQGKPSVSWLAWRTDIDERWEGFWSPTAEAHPFRDWYFCWLCLAEAQGIPAERFQHMDQDTPDEVCFR
jgi:hypothetical protein